MPEAPYKGAPKAPVLFIKTANTYTPSGGVIALPHTATEVDIGANLAWVFGADEKPVACVLVNDISIPHESYYRPPVKFKCVDGFLGVGSKARDIAQVNTDAVVITVKDSDKARAVKVAGDLVDLHRRDELVERARPRDDFGILCRVGRGGARRDPGVERLALR